MRSIKVILLLFLFINSCKSARISEINDFYREKYPELNEYILIKSKEISRKRVLTKYFKNNKIKELEEIIIIEFFKYPNGDFDNLNAEVYFYTNNKIDKLYTLIESEREVFIEEGKFIIPEYKKTIHLIIKLLKEKNYGKLKDLHKEIDFSVSNKGIIYATILDENFNVIDGVRFYEFIVNKKDPASLHMR